MSNEKMLLHSNRIHTQTMHISTIVHTDKYIGQSRRFEVSKRHNEIS